MSDSYEHIKNPLDSVIEEMAELTQAIIKSKRFGIDNWHPGTGETNRSRIYEEIADVKRAISNYEKYLDDEG